MVPLNPHKGLYLMHFSLVKINPTDASPSHGFDDFMLPLSYAMRALGYEVELRLNSFNPRSRNIVFGSCIAPRRTGRNMPAGSIIFNLEQINAENKFCNADYMAHLRDFEVWDYSEANVAALQAQGIKVVAYVPPAYVPEMTRLNPNFEAGSAGVDVLFYGLLTERRHEMVMQMKQAGLNIIVPELAFASLRDRLLAHSKLLLNIHAHYPARLELVRLGYVWANHKAVLSERRPDTEVPAYLEEACYFASYAELPEAALKLTRDHALRQKQAEQGFKSYSSRPLASILEKIIGARKVTGAPTIPPEQLLYPAPYYLEPVAEWAVN